MRQTWAIVAKKVSSNGVVTGTLATAVQNGSGNYQLVLWSIRDNGVVVRLPDPAGATGGKASKIQIVPVGRLFVSAMANADGELLLISHNNSFARLKDSAGQAGKVKALHLVTLTVSRVLTVCISAAGRLLNIVWEIQPDGSITRLFDSGSDGPRAKNVASVLYREDGSSQVVATVYANNSSKLVLSTWRIDGTSIDFVADSGNRMGAGDLAYLVNTATGHLVIVCRDGNQRLLLIPFSAAADGTDIARVSGGSARAGKVQIFQWSGGRTDY